MTLTPSISERERDPMGWLFGEIYGRFGNAFIDKFRSGEVVNGSDVGIENMKAVWAQQIREHRMSFGEIKRGLQGCDRLKFPPSWPEFFALCRPVPTVDDALREAVQQIPLRATGEDVWSHPAIYWAAHRVGFHDVVHQGGTALRQRMEVALASVLAGDVLPVPPATVVPALPAPEVSAEVVEQARADVAGMARGTVKTATSDGDHLRWARQIVERARKGDRSITLYRLRSAEEALGLR